MLPRFARWSARGLDSNVAATADGAERQQNGSDHHGRDGWPPARRSLALATYRQHHHLAWLGCQCGRSATETTETPPAAPTARFGGFGCQSKRFGRLGSPRLPLVPTPHGGEQAHGCQKRRTSSC